MARLKIIFLSLFLVGLFTGYYFYYSLTSPLILAGQDSVIVELKPKMTSKAFFYTLAKKKQISSPEVIIRYLQLKGLSKKLKAGIYKISPGDSSLALIYKLLKGQVVTKTFTIVEGTT